MAKRTRTEYSILNIVTGLGGYVLNTILGLVCRMIFTRTLNADYLGINGLFSNILSMLSLAELGIGTAIVYALYKPLAENDEAKIATLVQFYGRCYRAIGIFIGVVGLALLPFLNLLIPEQPAIKENLSLIYCLYLFNTATTYFFSYRSSLISASQRHYIVMGVSYIMTILESALQIVWLLWTHEYFGYLIIKMVGVLVYNVTISIIAKKLYPYIADKNIAPLEKDEKTKLVRNVRALVIWKISGRLVNSTDNIIITYFKGLITTGLTSNYTLLTGTLSSLLDLLFGSLKASIGNLNAVESKEKRMSMFYNINFANFWLYGWAAIGITVVSSELVNLLFGGRYVLPDEIPLILAVNFYMVGIQNTVWAFQNAMGLFRQGRYLLFLTAAFNLIFSILLGKVWGLFGILFATAISRLLTNYWYDPYKVFRHGFGEPVLPYYMRRIRYMLILAATGGVCYVVSKAVQWSPLGNCIYRALVCTVIPNGVFFLLFHKSPEFRYFIVLPKRLLAKIRRRK
jgi:O-antigen/teichoic acid export membrane protein